jgi:uncharacterized protein (DUF433 family)
VDALLRERISLDPRVMLGKTVIRGTRIPVALLVHILAQGIRRVTCSENTLPYNPRHDILDPSGE